MSKKFRRGTYHDTLRDLLASGLAGLLGRDSSPDDEEEFWAVEDVTFTVEPGEVVGVIGPNGAGKSTLLKLATGILKPDRGTVEVRGRVGALIELAAGFHSELTGGENIYLQGAIMGMAREEVARKFDEIVEFAGVGKFVDTPVKRYSSGMRVRLGFAIAAHLEPDVLLMDEVLTVGDREFQEKAEARLREIVEREIPVLIVSHQLERVTAFCDRAIFLAGGRIHSSGPVAECIDDYIVGRHLDREGPAPSVQIDGLHNVGPSDVAPGGEVRLELEGTVNGAGDPEACCVGVRLRGYPDLQRLWASNNDDCGVALPDEGRFRLEIRFRANVAPGLYSLEGVVWDLRSGRERERGPSALVEVDRSVEVRGTVHMDPRMRRLPE